MPKWRIHTLLIFLNPIKYYRAEREFLLKEIRRDGNAGTEEERILTATLLIATALQLKGHTKYGTRKIQRARESTFFTGLFYDALSS
jgi:hypothetical protein